MPAETVLIESQIIVSIDRQKEVSMNHWDYILQSNDHQDYSSVSRQNWKVTADSDLSTVVKNVDKIEEVPEYHVSPGSSRVNNGDSADNEKVDFINFNELEKSCFSRRKTLKFQLPPEIR